MSQGLIELPQGINVGILNIDRFYEIWGKLKKFDSPFDDGSRWDIYGFCRRLYDKGTILLEDDGGVMLLSDIHPNHYAACHLTYWDKSLSRRAGKIKELIQWAFLQFNLQRLETTVGEWKRAVRMFVEKRLGFKFEGRLRKRVSYKGNLSDLLIYSILKEEVQ